MGVYALKARSNADGVFMSVAGIGERYYIPRIIGETFDKITNGVVLTVLVLATFVTALWRHLKDGSSRTLIIGLVALAALTSMAEGFLTYSTFVGIYYSIMLYFVFFLSFVLIQLGLDSLAARAFPHFIRTQS